jgi:FkbM family methyltransferase
MTIYDAFRTLKFIWSHPLNQEHKIDALVKFIKWQLGTLLLNTSIIVPWINDCSFIAEKGDRGLTGNIYGGLMEPEEMLFLLRTLQPNWHFIDIGANIGAYTLLASKVIGANSTAFEPVPDTIKKLKTQIALNHIVDKVEVVMAGVGEKPELLHFTNLNSTTNHVCVNGKSANTIQVKMVKLDDIVKPSGQPIFLKIDVEGFEFPAIKGAINLLKSGRVKAIVIELCGAGLEYGFNDNDIHELLLSLGYEAVKYDYRNNNLEPIDSYRKDSPNTIYIKNIGEITQSIKSLKTFSLLTPVKIEI